MKSRIFHEPIKVRHPNQNTNVRFRETRHIDLEQVNAAEQNTTLRGICKGLIASLKRIELTADPEAVRGNNDALTVLDECRCQAKRAAVDGAESMREMEG